MLCYFVALCLSPSVFLLYDEVQVVETACGSDTLMANNLIHHQSDGYTARWV